MVNRLKFGDANPVDPSQTPSALDPNHFSGIDNIKKNAIESTQPKLLKKIIGPIKGIVLKIKKTPISTSANSAGDFSWISAIYGNSSIPNLPIYYVRIPEFHSHLPEPEDYANCPDSIAILYPEFITMKEGVEGANPGDLVWVDFVDRENFSEPIFLEKIDSTAPPGLAGGANSAAGNSGGSLNMTGPSGFGPNGQVPVYDDAQVAAYNKNNNPTIYSKQKIEAAVKRKGYQWYEDGLNVVGIRNSSTGKRVTDLYDDVMMIAYKENGNWQYHEFTITTDPGLKPTLSPKNPRGVGRLKPGQYISSHFINLHRGQYYAGFQSWFDNATVTVFRDNNRDQTYNESDQQTGVFGINLHRAQQVPREKTRDSVSLNSEGCNVFRYFDQFNFFMSILYKFNNMYSGDKGRPWRLNYTLIESSDII